MNNLTIGHWLFGISTLVFLVVAFLSMRPGIKSFTFFSWAFFGILTLVNHIIWELTGDGFNQSIPYHIRFGLEGTGISGFYRLIVLSGVCLLFLIIMYVVFRKFILPNNSPNNFYFFPVWVQLVLLFSHPLWPEIYDTYKIQEASSIPLQQHFRTPDSLTSLKVYPNIVWIYAESMERTFMHDSVFPGLTPNLKNLESRSLSFTNVHQLYGTGWTIAGIVASHCGVPLVTMGLNGNELNKMKHFLPRAVGIGDLLSKKNYRLEFVQGSSGWFAGTNRYMRSHGFHLTDIENLKDSLTLSDPDNEWGITDDQLFRICLGKYADLQKGKQPFALMFSTIDTHPPEGRVPPAFSNKKYRDGSNKLLNSVHCSDSLLVAFISELKKLDPDNNTLIVLSSDHLAMPNVADDLLNSVDRRNLLMYYWPGKIKPALNSKPACTFDEGITTLQLLGFPETELGLGKSLLSSSKTFKETFGPKADKQLRGWEGELNQLWRANE